jgi:hypothetical protein
LAETGVDLSITSGGTATATTPGHKVTAPDPIVVTNTGTVTVTGFTVRFMFVDPGEEAVGNEFDGCDTSSSPAPDVTYYVCTVQPDTPLAAGDTYTWPKLEVMLTDAAVGDQRKLAYDVGPLDGTPDDDPTNNSGTFTMDLPVDLQAVGGTATGSIGDTVDLTVGVKNNGPFALGRLQSDVSEPSVKLAVPVGTEVVAIPKGCIDLTLDDPDGNDQQLGQPFYSCSVPVSPKIAVGESRLFTFKIKITGAPAALAMSFGQMLAAPKKYTGKVSVRWTPDWNADTDTGNDEVDLTVTQIDVPIGTMPPTGAVVTGYVVGGLLLVGLGVIAVIGARRRRTRTTT